MPKSRKFLIDVDCRFVHIVSRCVRRAFLCGFDTHSGKNFDHRRGWIEREILRLAGIFSLEVAAFAVMSNHYHLVLCINREDSQLWSEQEIVERWHQLFNGSPQSQRFASGLEQDQASRSLLTEQIGVWRDRLGDISWFMRVLNEKVARMANQEDECTGRFWEGRFKSQALLDEKALLACMAYVDLNPVRAGITTTPGNSTHTSARLRIEATRGNRHSPETEQPSSLQPFAGSPIQSVPQGLPFRLSDYLDLLDWTARSIGNEKAESPTEAQPAILRSLGMKSNHYLFVTRHFESNFKSLVGSIFSLKRACERLGMQRIPGRTACETLF